MYIIEGEGGRGGPDQPSRNFHHHHDHRRVQGLGEAREGEKEGKERLSELSIREGWRKNLFV